MLLCPFRLILDLNFLHSLYLGNNAQDDETFQNKIGTLVLLYQNKKEEDVLLYQAICGKCNSEETSTKK